MKNLFRTAVIAIAAVLGVSATANAAAISLYQAPDNTYQNTANSPCIFYGPGNCPQDPAGWPTPTGDTGGGTPFVPNPLLQSYTGTEYSDEWLDVVGTSFVIGLDINDTGTSQILSDFTVNFYGAGNVLLGTYTYAPDLAVPNGSNGVGYADYILAAGCAGTEAGAGATATCTLYSPFVAPAGTIRLDFSFGMTGFNDGPDKIFVIPYTTDEPCLPGVCSPVPEPASMMLLGTGLAGLAFAVRRRRRTT